MHNPFDSSRSSNNGPLIQPLLERTETEVTTANTSLATTTVLTLSTTTTATTDTSSSSITKTTTPIIPTTTSAQASISLFGAGGNYLAHMESVLLEEESLQQQQQHENNNNPQLRSQSDPTAIHSATTLPSARPATRLPTVDMSDDTFGGGGGGGAAVGMGVVGMGVDAQVDATVVPPASRSVFESTAIPMTPPPQPAPVLRTPQESDERPWDLLGPPADPLNFDRPRFDRGRRDQVLCYIPDTEAYERFNNVLFRDEATSGPRRQRMELAYYPLPYKRPIKTIMGHVEICRVLQRSRLSAHDDDSSRCSVDEEEDEDEESEVCFELTDRHVAVKVNFDSRMRELRNRHAEDPIKEISAMQLIGDNTPHVLGCSEVLYDPGNQTLNIVMRYCQSGDLFQRLQESQAMDDEGPPGMPEAQARFFFRQIMTGIRALHDKGVCHRDISPENVMLDQDESVIIDLGMCLRVPRVGDRRCLIKPQGACGKLPYMSPEIYRNRSAFDGAAADVWTAGTILFCMVTGNRSYQRPHASDPQFYWMTRDLNQLLSDWTIQLSPEGLHLLQNMLQVNPRLRLDIDEVLNHPWFSFPDERPSADMEF